MCIPAPVHESRHVSGILCGTFFFFLFSFVWVLIFFFFLPFLAPCQRRRACTNRSAVVRVRICCKGSLVLVRGVCLHAPVKPSSFGALRCRSSRHVGTKKKKKIIPFSVKHLFFFFFPSSGFLSRSCSSGKRHPA